MSLFFIMMSQLQHWKHHEAQLITHDIIMKNNGKVCDVRSLACIIKDLNGQVPTACKWTIALKFYMHLVPFFIHQGLIIQLQGWQFQNKSCWYGIQWKFSFFQEVEVIDSTAAKNIQSSGLDQTPEENDSGSDQSPQKKRGRGRPRVPDHLLKKVYHEHMHTWKE